jgi:DNA-binding MarR family transcriptional regulator
VVTEKSSGTAPRVPSPEEVQEILGFLPLLAAFFQRARTDMPAELSEAFSRHRLTARHGAVLTQLLATQQISVSELARRMGLSLPTVSELVGDLSRAGWVERHEDASNRRRTLVVLPADRRPDVETFIAARAEPLLRTVAALSPRDRKGFVAGLKSWATEVSDW